VIENRDFFVLPST